MEDKNAFLKQLKNVIYLSVVMARHMFPPFDILWVYCFAKKAGNDVIKAKPVSFAEYCHSSGDKFTIIEKEQKRKVYEPAYFGKTEGNEHEFFSKPIYIAELNNVSILGGTGLVLSRDEAITDVCVNDTDNRVRYVSGAIRRANKKRFYLEVQGQTEEIDKAINLCGLAACNYYHLTFEILSRFGYIKQYCDECDIPVLIDAGIQKIPQFMELAKHILGERTIVFVPEYKRILCRKLIQPSMNTWMPMNVIKKYDFRVSDNLIARSAVDNIRQATNDYRLGKANKKVFISRKNAFLSRIENEEEVADLFRRNGFEIICTEDLNYREQVELFSSASCIVGASGAALTNLVYCNPGTVFGCMIPEKYNFCIYSSLAYMVGCKVLFFDAAITKHGSTISTEQCKVNIDECGKYIKKLEELINT